MKSTIFAVNGLMLTDDLVFGPCVKSGDSWYPLNDFEFNKEYIHRARDASFNVLVPKKIQEALRECIEASMKA